MRTILLLISLAVFGSASAQDSNFYFNDDVSGERTTLVFDGDHYTLTIDVYSAEYQVIIMGTYSVDVDGTIALHPERKGHTKLLHPQPNGSYLYTDGNTVQRLRHH